MERISNEEKASQLANYFAGETDYKESAAYSAAITMAQWKDEEHAKEKQEWIDEAAEWLESVNLDYYQIREGVFSKELVDDFRKAMKGE